MPSAPPAYRPPHASVRRRTGSVVYGRRWERRARLFRALYPLCGMRPGGLAPVLSQCHARGRVTPATCVDHVVPHRGDARLFWDELGNWQALCWPCHARKTSAGL